MVPVTIARCMSPGCEWSAMYQLRPTAESAEPCETCQGTGHVPCWDPGGPCERPPAPECETCGTCLSCVSLLLCEDHAAPFLDLPTLRGVG